MRNIYGIGETVLDIIFKDGQPQAAKPGGSMLNGLVSLGRVGLPARFISDYGRDDVGSLIDDFLGANGVDTSSVYRYSNGKTTLAIAFLNEKNDARYTFYRDFPDERLKIDPPDFSPDDVLLFGSFYAITREIREALLRVVRAARRKGALILYDPNFRKAHLHELEQLRPYIIENMQMADVVKGSDEDFSIIFGTSSPEEAYQAISGFCSTLIYTENTKGVQVITPSVSARFPARKITPVSTIGAGDNFNAGLIAAIWLQNIRKEDLVNLDSAAWSPLISMAVDFATEVCLSYENYVSADFAKTILRNT